MPSISLKKTQKMGAELILNPALQYVSRSQILPAMSPCVHRVGQLGQSEGLSEGRLHSRDFTAKKKE